MDTFREFQAIIRKGDYSGEKGWGGTHVGKFWGGLTIQGILPYFYYKLHPGRGFEVWLHSYLISSILVYVSQNPREWT